MLAPILGGATESSLHAALWWLSFWDAQKCSCNCNRPKNSVSTTSSVSGWARNGRPRLDSEPQAGTCGLVIGFWWTFVGSECCDESTTLDPREQVSWRQARCLHCQWIIFEPIWYSCNIHGYSTGQFPERWAFRFASRYHVPSAILLKLSTASLGEVMEKPQRSQKVSKEFG